MGTGDPNMPEKVRQTKDIFQKLLGESEAQTAGEEPMEDHINASDVKDDAEIITRTERKSSDPVEVQKGRRRSWNTLQAKDQSSFYYLRT